MSRLTTCLFYLSVLHHHGIAARETNGSLSQSDLLVVLTRDDRYNKYLIPHFQTDDPINVTVNMKIISIGELNAANMEYSIGMYLRLVWMDERLSFEHLIKDNEKYKEFVNLEDLDVHPNFLTRIWQPDPAFTNFKDGSLQQLLTPSKMLRIFKNGTVLFSTLLTVQFSCPMDLRLYPLDVQRCHIEFESFGYRDKNIRFVWHEVEPVEISADDVNMPQFQLLRQDTCANRCRRQLATGNFTCLRVSFFFKRSYGYHLLQTYLPSILIVVLSWVSFYINPDAIPGRVTVGVTSVLTMTTQSSGSRKDLPPVSYVKAIDLWMTTCLTFVFAALLEFAYVNTLREREKKRERKQGVSYLKHKTHCEDDEYDPRVSLDDAQKTHHMDVGDEKLPCPNVVDGRGRCYEHQGSSCCHQGCCVLSCLGKKMSQRVDNLSKILFPLAFICFNAIYWLFYMLWDVIDRTCPDLV